MKAYFFETLFIDLKPEQTETPAVDLLPKPDVKWLINAFSSSSKFKVIIRRFEIKVKSSHLTGLKPYLR